MILAIVNNYAVTSIVTIPDASTYDQYAQGAQACIDITGTTPEPQVGWVFNGVGLTAPANYVASWQITKLAFRERFALAELEAIYSAQQTNLTLQVLQDNLAVSTYIDLSRADTIQGVDYLVSVGLLTAPRAATILTTPPSAMELYQG